VCHGVVDARASRRSSIGIAVAEVLGDGLDGPIKVTFAEWADLSSEASIDQSAVAVVRLAVREGPGIGHSKSKSSKSEVLSEHFEGLLCI
jgi:hypothetical protein